MGGWVGKNANLVRIEKTIGIYVRPLTVFINKAVDVSDNTVTSNNQQDTMCCTQNQCN